MVARGKRVKRAQPLVNVSRKFPRTPVACGDSGAARYRGCALRAYPRLHSLHRFAVPADRKVPNYF